MKKGYYMNEEKFTKKYKITNEVLNAITHGIGFGLSIAGLIILLLKGVRLQSSIHIVSYALFGSGLILLFLMSTLYHSLIFTKAKRVFRIFDHSFIFVLIAGTYSPYCLLAIRGGLGLGLFIAIWVMAILGVIYKAIWLEKSSKISTIIYLIMGWLVVFAIRPLYANIGFHGILYLVLGGLAYSVGAFFYSKKHIKFMHVVWHLFVLFGAMMMYFSVLFYT